MAKKRATLTDLLNDLTFKVLYDKYKLLAMNVFKWEGLPPGMEERHIERELFDKGRCLFVQDKSEDTGRGYFALSAQEGKGLNVYGDATKWRAIGLNYNKEYSADECVLIENNKLRLATSDVVMFYVNKLTEAERTMDVNVKAVKTPIVFACDSNDVLTFKRIFQQVDGNVPAIYADRALNMDSIQAFDTKATFLGNELMDYKKSVENELLTFLGVNNIAQDKKERLITDEANSNNQLISSFFDMQYEARQRACEAINAMYGLNVRVSKREPLVDKSVDMVDNQEGGDDNVD